MIGWTVFGTFLGLILIICVVVPQICYAIFKPSKEDIKKFNKTAIQQMLFNLVAASFLLVDLNKWVPWQFVVGVVLIVAIFVRLVVYFINGPKDNFQKFESLYYFIWGIGLTIYLIFRIEDTNLQNIVTAIIAAVYGGLITLVGVAWTIKKTDSDKKEKEREKAKPYILLSVLVNARREKCVACHALPETKDAFFSIDTVDDNNCVESTIDSFVIYNTDIAHLLIKAVVINGVFLPIEPNVFMVKGCYSYLTFDQKVLLTKEKMNSISVVVKDILENEYISELVFEQKLTYQIKGVYNDIGTKKSDHIKLDYQIFEIIVTDVKPLKEYSNGSK